MKQLYTPFKKKIFAPLLLQCILLLAFVGQGFGQEVATLPTRHQGPWQTGLPTGWVQNGLGVDRPTDMGTNTSKASAANFNSVGDFIEITIDDVAGQVAFWIKAESGRNYGGLTFEVHEKTIGGTYTVAGGITNPVLNSATGERVVVSLQPTTRTVKLVLVSATGGTATVDDVLIAKAVPKMNIHKEGISISTGSVYPYGILPLGEQSAPVLFTIENTGTADLLLTDLSTIAVLGENPSDFIVNASNTATTIAPGRSTTFTVTFKPTEVGVRSALISIANNDAEVNPYTFTVTGEGVYCPVVNELDIYEGKVGDYVYIYGSNFNDATKVTFGGVEAPGFFVVDDNTIDVQVPEGAVTGPIEVFTTECSAQSATFTVLMPLIELSKSTMSLSAEVGSSIIDQYLVSAQYLDEGADVVISVNGTAGPVSISRDGVNYFQSITFTAAEIKELSRAAGAAYNTLPQTTLYVKYESAEVASHTVNISHTSSNAETQNLVVNGVATAPPVCAVTVDGLDIYEGKEGDYVYIYGSNFNDATKVTFGGVEVAGFFVVDDNTIDVQVPEGAVTGPIEVFTTECSAQSATFTVLGPTITLTPTSLATFTAAIGEASAVQEYTVTGQYLTEAVTVTAPTHYQISSTPDGVFGTSLTLQVDADGNLATRTVYVRFMPTAAGEHRGVITNASSGEIQNIAVAGTATASPLPVELIAFKVVKQDKAVLLTWATASELNNDFFEVEMAEDTQIGFKAVGKVSSAVNNSSVKQNYQFRHTGSFTGTRYYRLKQVDQDGTFEYSRIVAVESRGRNFGTEAQVYPNPITPGSKLNLTVAEAGKVNVSVVNMSGTRVHSQSYDVEGGDNNIELNLRRDLPTGVYILTTEFKGQTQQVKLIKQ